MSARVVVRPTTLEDVRGFWECVGEVARERRYLTFVDAPPFESSRAWVGRLLEAGFPHRVAVDDGRVVGWCDIAPFPSEAFRHSGRLGMGLLPPYRGRGIGAELLGSALEEARSAGLERVELDVFAANVRARRLYEKFGFELEGTRRRAWKLDGIYDDVLEMALFLETGDVRAPGRR